MDPKFDWGDEKEEEEEEDEALNNSEEEEEGSCSWCRWYTVSPGTGDKSRPV